VVFLRRLLRPPPFPLAPDTRGSARELLVNTRPFFLSCDFFALRSVSRFTKPLLPPPNLFFSCRLFALCFTSRSPRPRAFSGALMSLGRFFGASLFLNASSSYPFPFPRITGSREFSPCQGSFLPFFSVLSRFFPISYRPNASYEMSRVWLSLLVFFDSTQDGRCDSADPQLFPSPTVGRAPLHRLRG